MAQRILITGVSGFVGRTIVDYLQLQENAVAITGVDMAEPGFALPANTSFQKMNLLDEDAVGKLVKILQPQAVIHLASFSKVSESWVKPIESFKNNTNIFLNLIEAIRLNSPLTKLLSVGSSEEYGIADPAALPLTEESKLNPNSPYSVARVSQEWMSKVYAKGYGLNVVITRSFNHYGIYQHDNFVIPSLVKQMCGIKKGSGNNVLYVGNIDVVRDFIHVKDVVKAYACLLEKGIPGEVYNICTGRGVSLRGVIEMISDKLGIAPEIAINKALYRPNDNPVIIGENSKLRKLGWEPGIALEQGLDELISHYLEKV